MQRITPESHQLTCFLHPYFMRSCVQCQYRMRESAHYLISWQQLVKLVRGSNRPQTGHDHWKLKLTVRFLVFLQMNLHGQGEFVVLQPLLHSLSSLHRLIQVFRKLHIPVLSPSLSWILVILVIYSLVSPWKIQINCHLRLRAVSYAANEVKIPSFNYSK